MASQNLADTSVKAYLGRPASHTERWSDHAPVNARSCYRTPGVGR
ncbi:hypothetical protein ACFV0O_13320 [Kitasatospora sp. NPDC059577]